MEEQGLINETPFAVQQLFLMDEQGRDILVLVIKATYQIDGTSKLEISDKQVPVNVSGEYYGEPGKSSFKYEPEIASIKLATDVVLIGHAYPDRLGAAKVDVTLKVGTLQKTVRVFGERYWTNTIGFKRISSPESFDKIPLVYERAFGGWDRANSNPRKYTYEPRNPFGKGYGKFAEGKKLPNLEDPKYLIKNPKDKPPPAGFGFIGPEWEPRRFYAGTYDENWMKKKMPLLPEDFDRLYYNAAHPDLISKGYLKGNEPVEIVNASQKGLLKFHLPGITSPEGIIILKNETTNKIDTNLDTAIINTDENILFLIWRGHVDIHEKIHEINALRVYMSNACSS